MNLNLLIIICILPLLVKAMPSRRFPFEADGETAKTTQIDINNPEHQLLLQTFNLSSDQLEKLRSVRLGSSNPISTTNENDTFKDIKDLRKESIKADILNVVRGVSPEQTIHEMAAYPMCNQGNMSQWEQENNITVKFSPTLFEHKDRELYLDTAVLRLFKLNPEDPESRTPTKVHNNCEDLPIDSQIRITVSTIQQPRRNKRGRDEEKKKRICNTIMLNMSHTGWVEIDVKRAINIWEKFERQSRSTNSNTNSNSNNNRSVMVGALTIEVDDEEGRPLKAGQFFEPPTCSQANAAVPWNFYRIYSWSAADMEKVPRFPRLDIKFFNLHGLNQYNQNKHNQQNRNNNRNFYHHHSLSPNCNHSTETNNNHHHHHHHQHNNNNNNNNNNQMMSEKFEMKEYTDTTITNSQSSIVSSVTPTIDNLLEETSPDIRLHRKRHGQNHNNHHHHNHHHSTSSTTMTTDDRDQSIIM